MTRLRKMLLEELERRDCSEATTHCVLEGPKPPRFQGISRAGPGERESGSCRRVLHARNVPGSRNSSRKPLPQSVNGRFAHDSARSSRHMPSADGQILRNLRSHPMTAADFRRIVLSLEGVEEYSHAGLPAFRVGGRKFASLASQAGGYGNLMLTLEQQAAFVEEAPEIFLPIPGGWGKMGHTHIRLAASEDVLTGALRTAWKLRIDKNAKTSRKKTMWRSAAE